MSMYWAEQHVAVNIVDDPDSPDFDRRVDPEATVLEVSYERMTADPEYTREFADRLANELGCEPPQDTPEWRAANRRLCEQLSDYRGGF